MIYSILQNINQNNNNNNINIISKIKNQIKVLI